MKKVNPKKKESNGLVLGVDSSSYTETPLGEPSARVTIHHGDIEGLEYDTDWKSHSLVTLHAVSYTHLTLPTKRIV